MSINVNPKIGSGFQQHYQDWPGKNHGPTDLVAIANWENAVPSITGRVSEVMLGGAASLLPTSGSLPYRRKISISNVAGTGTLYIGFNVGVTSGNGFPIAPNTTKDLDIAGNIPVYGIGIAAGTLVRILELG